MRRMVFFENLSYNYIEQLKKLAPDWEIICIKDSKVYTQYLADAEIVAGWNKHTVKECFKQGAALRWVHTWAAGVNTLPLKEFKDRNIMLTNSSGVHAYPISETVFAMMLSLTRKLNIYARNQIKKDWAPKNNKLEMHEKTIGILGIGAIGEETARLAKAFGMKVLGYRRTGQASPNVDCMFDSKGIIEMMSQSDYVVNTLPLTKETFGLMGADQFRHMKPTAFYINIGRGDTTDEDALVEALQGNLIAGAGLDVFVQEPLPKESPLWDLENVIITPHDAGETENYNDRVMKIFIPNLKDYLNGRKPGMNLVDLDLEY